MGLLRSNVICDVQHVSCELAEMPFSRQVKQCYVDIQKAFDTKSHNTLLNKLADIGQGL